MGNCCRPASSSLEWGGEDWDYLKSDDNYKRKNTRKTRSNKVFDDEGCQGLISLGNAHKEKLLGALRASCDADGKVKIRISKKELKELLGGSSTGNGIEKRREEEEEEEMKKKQVVGRRASAEQVLLRLLKARDHDDPHTPWKPVLDSIPELN